MSSITAGTSSGTALVHTADTTGALVVKTGAASAVGLTVDANQITNLANPLPVSSGGTGATTLSGITVGNATTATTATNLAGGGAGQLPYQTASGTTAMLAAGTSGQVLTSSGAGAPTWATVAAGTVNTFSTSGTWTKPSGVSSVLVQLWGAGGGGGSGAIGTTANGGGGGGGGGCNTYVFPASLLPSTVTVTVGAGGTGGASQTSGGGVVGNNGGNTTFGTYLTAIGGSGGTLATYNAGGAGGGNGFSTTNGYGTAGGAQSGTQGGGNSAEYGGGSGGAGNVSGQVWGATGGSSMFGGAGGAGGVPISGSGSGYSLYGGISTDTVGATNTTGAASGNPGSPNGVAGASQFRTIVPVGGGGGGGASGAPFYPPSTRNLIANGNLFQVITTGLVYSTNGGTTWSYINFLPNTCVGIGYINSTYYAAMSNGQIFSSTNLSTWTLASTITLTTGYLTSFCSNATTLLAAGNIPASNTYGGCYYSTNGTTWTNGTGQNGATQYSIVRFNNGYFWQYTLGGSATTIYSYSTDGINWASVNTNGAPSIWPRSAAFGSSNGVIINMWNTTSYGVSYGPPSAMFTQALTGTSFNDVAYGAGVFVLVAGSGVIYTSSDDGVNWTARTSGTTDNLISVFYTGTKFIAITGNNGFKTIESTNGTTWTTGVTIAASSFNAGNGGAGGLCSGGGGGGAALSGTNSGAGGNGGNGYARIYAW